MKVTVGRVEDVDPRRSLVWGVDETGRRVSFHVPVKTGGQMRMVLASGRALVVELPVEAPK